MNHAVILAGGGGTRLWPASRRQRPKQLLPLGASPPEGGTPESLLGATCRRLGTVVPPGHTWVVTAASQIEGVLHAVPGLPADRVLGEPCARNTAAAIGLAALRLATEDPQAVLGVLPADQHVADEEAFRATAARAFAVATAEDVIVTVGIPPTRPETGFGYLEVEPGEPGQVRRVRRFVEKPDRAAAERYVAAGYLWNAGMFFLSATRALAEIRVHLPELAAGLSRIAAGEPEAAVYPSLPSISIDHGVMERTRSPILTLAGDFGWNDVGAWPALADYRPAGTDGNVTDGLVLASEARGNIAVTDDDTLIALVGVHDLVVVKAGNAILVVPRNRAQDVRAIVSELERRGLEQYL